MQKIVFRDLRPEEIEVRVGNIIKDKNKNPKGFQLLLYKTSRTDMQLLDETFGTFGWRNHFYQVKNTMVCSIEIWDEDKKEWVNKDNGGDDDTPMEQVKSELSDSIKRAGSTLGIGRKLYSASKIYMVVDIDENNDPSYSRYQVKDIDYDEKGITKLVIINKKTKDVVISYGSDEKVSKKAEKPQKNTNEARGSIAKEQLDYINLCLNNFREDTRTRFYDWLDRNYHTMNVETLTLTQGKEVANYLSGNR